MLSLQLQKKDATKVLRRLAPKALMFLFVQAITFTRYHVCYASHLSTSLKCVHTGSAAREGAEQPNPGRMIRVLNVEENITTLKVR